MTSGLLSSTSGADDATLARAAATGDRAAFAAIYDRYADRLYDFCVGMLRDRDAAADCVQDVFVTAATKLVQLREPDRLRSWLYAIARSEALSRIRDRKREQLSEELPDMPSGEADPATQAASSELAELIREASGGLSDRDRVVLELAYRQGLDGPELADALGVTPKNANTLVERMRDTIGRSLGALLLCKRAKADPERCPELAAIIEQGDDQFTVLLRKRVARHVDGCAICEEERARMVNPAALLGSAPVVIPAPAWLRDRTLDNAVVNLPPAGSTPVGPEDDASWWPPHDLDVDDLSEPPGAAGPRQTASVVKGRPVRAGIGAALVLVGIGAAAMLVAPASFRVVPADSHAPLTPSSTTTASTTTPSVAKRTATSDTPAMLPPPVVATTTTANAVITPTTETTSEPSPVEKPLPRTHDQTPDTTTETSRPTPQPQDGGDQSPNIDPPNIVEPPAEEPPVKEPPGSPPVKPPKPTPKLPSRIPPPVKVEPDCPPQDTNCNGGGGPIFN
ncbi:RNA polymerase sigma factor [Mycolicibacterium hodleri]|uniref:RNA polymerase sigma factor n=1 Tax=Mycolicibacterium hodleri TaxID=49897 RepID=A0A502EE71_9MYCO|nr:RNA polymerase sigma factor [Mycolicibacterium hodleri]TPG35309.1 RNA polymerase sigma factor [Mycolicibacterium hodleri]